MFKRPTKKQLLIRRIFFSVIATLSVLIILTASILFMLGFRLDNGNGRLEQGALLQFDSTPNSASVWIDGKNTGVNTAGKQTVAAGVHTVLFAKDKYEDWSRTVNFAAGTLTWLDYARLVPKERAPEAVAHFQTAVAAKASPDMKYILLQEAADQPSFQLADLRSVDVKLSTLTLPNTLYSEPTTAGVTHTFTLREWNSGGRYIFITHQYNDQTEWLMVDTQDVSQSINISRTLSVGFKDMHFSGTSGKNVFALDANNNIRKLDLSANTISRALISNVASFSLFEDTSTISYIGLNSSDTSKRVAGIYRDGDEAPHVLREVAATDTALSIVVSRYFNDDYVAIADGPVVSILKGSYPTSTDDNSSLKPLATMTLTGPVTQLSFSPKGDYVLAQAGTSFMSYEIEHLRSASGSIDTNPQASPTPLQWLDIAHLWNQQNGSLVMRDFDNSNIYAISSATGTFDATLSQNGRYFYSIAKSGDGFVLQRVKMILG